MSLVTQTRVVTGAHRDRKAANTRRHNRACRWKWKGGRECIKLPSVLLSSQFEVAPGLCPFWQSYIKISCYCSLWGLHSFVRERSVLLRFVSFAPWLFLAIDQPETQERGKHCFMLAYTSQNDRCSVCVCACVAKDRKWSETAACMKAPRWFREGLSRQPQKPIKARFHVFFLSIKSKGLLVPVSMLDG